MRRLLLPLGLAVLAYNPAFAQPAGLPASSPISSAGDTAAVESVGALTLATALELAGATSPELAAARRELAAVEALIAQARVRPNPELSTSVEEINSDTRTTRIQLSQPIELGGKRDARIEAAQRARDVAAADFEAARARLRAKVMAAFFAVLIAQERVDLARAVADLAQRTTAAASKRVTAGKVSPVEETRAQVAEATVGVELMQAAAELEVARRRLAATWGNTDPRFTRVAGQMETLPAVPDLADLYSRLDDSALLARARRETKRRRAVLELERARRIPNLTVSLGVEHSRAFDSSPQGLLGVSIPLPLFDRNQGNIAEAQQRVYQARDELAATEIRLKSALAQLHARLGVVQQEVEALRTNILPGAQRAYEAATKGFELGKFSFLDVLDAQRTLFQAQSQYLRALSRGNQARAELQRILGDGSVGSASTAQP